MGKRRHETGERSVARSAGDAGDSLELCLALINQEVTDMRGTMRDAMQGGSGLRQSDGVPRNVRFTQRTVLGGFLDDLPVAVP